MTPGEVANALPHPLLRGRPSRHPRGRERAPVLPGRGPAEWEALIKALKAEATADATVERINGASIEDLVAQYQAQKAHEKVKVYDQKGKPKLELKDLGL
jgi:hypothetical protein